MPSYCDITRRHITGTTSYIEMSDATFDSQTIQKVFQQEPEAAAAGSRVTTIGDRSRARCLLLYNKPNSDMQI